MEHIKTTVPPSPQEGEGWEEEFDKDYGHSLQSNLIGIVAAALGHERQFGFGTDASFITRKLKKIIEAEIASRDAALVEEKEKSWNEGYAYGLGRNTGGSTWGKDSPSLQSH